MLLDSDSRCPALLPQQPLIIWLSMLILDYENWDCVGYMRWTAQNYFSFSFLIFFALYFVLNLSLGLGINYFFLISFSSKTDCAKAWTANFLFWKNTPNYFLTFFRMLSLHISWLISIMHWSFILWQPSNVGMWARCIVEKNWYPTGLNSLLGFYSYSEGNH